MVVYVGSMDVHVANKDDKDDGKDPEVTVADPNDTSIDKDDKWQTLAVGKSIDLVQHQGETAAEWLGQLDLPEGKVTQIRLFIDTTQSNTATVDGTTCDLDMSNVSSEGVKISHPFKAFDTKKTSKHEIWVDLDLKESMTATGACYSLKPVIKLHKVKTDGTPLSVL